MPDAAPPGFVEHGHRDSRALTWAFVPAVLFCVPGVPLVGLVLGVVGVLRERRRGSAAPFVAVVVLALVCTGIQALVVVGAWRSGEHTSAGPAVHRDLSGRVTQVGDASVDQLRAGDCFNADDSPDTGIGFASLSSVVEIPCTRPHDFEVYRQYALQGDVYPGDGELARDAATGCARAFASFVGVPEKRSTLVVMPYFPTRTGWDDDADHRDVTCVVSDPRQDVTGSLRGAHR